jgi:hypothetical protein
VTHRPWFKLRVPVPSIRDNKPNRDSRFSALGHPYPRAGQNKQRPVPDDSRCSESLMSLLTMCKAYCELLLTFNCYISYPILNPCCALSVGNIWASYAMVYGSISWSLVVIPFKSPTNPACLTLLLACNCPAENFRFGYWWQQFCLNGKNEFDFWKSNSFAYSSFRLVVFKPLKSKGHTVAYKTVPGRRIRRDFPPGLFHFCRERDFA